MNSKAAEPVSVSDFPSKLADPELEELILEERERLTAACVRRLNVRKAGSVSAQMQALKMPPAEEMAPVVQLVAKTG